MSLARLAQSVERKALNLVVVGPSPTVGVSSTDSTFSSELSVADSTSFLVPQMANQGAASSILIFESIQDSLAEWSKALASGASPQGHGFEPHSCH
jgi:hypothetical protein